MQTRSPDIFCDMRITLGEFFAEDQDVLSDSDAELIRRVKSLSREQKSALLTLLRSVK